MSTTFLHSDNLWSAYGLFQYTLFDEYHQVKETGMCCKTFAVNTNFWRQWAYLHRDATKSDKKKLEVGHVKQCYCYRFSYNRIWMFNTVNTKGHHLIQMWTISTYRSYRVSGLCSLSGILNTKKTCFGNCFHPQVKEGHTYSIGSLRNN
jgi:hypothetical protein